MNIRWIVAVIPALLLPLCAQEERVLAFSTQKLDPAFRAEGAAFVDIDGDGVLDAVNADRWWRGPAFEEAHLWCTAKIFDPKVYSETFFIWSEDLDNDKDQDLLVVGFPGRELRWHENPGKITDTVWPVHTVFEGVDNESPAFEDMDGDGRREIVAMHEGALGFIARDRDGDAKKPWAFSAITPTGIGGRFTHGLGVGDINGDGLKDVLLKNAWFQHPPQHTTLGWQRHDQLFAEAGGAQMLVFDADGDGLADVVSADHAHGYGMTFHRQVRTKDGSISFEAHRFMGSERRHNRFGCCVGGLHAAALVDLSGDGIPDVVTGNRPFAHGGHDAADRGAATLLWFETLRGPAGDVEFIPHVIDEVTGVGTQVTVDDVEHDGAADIVVSNKLGFSVVRGKVNVGPRHYWQEHQPRAIGDFDPAARPHVEWSNLGLAPPDADGRPINADFEGGDMQGWTLTGDAFKEQPIRGDSVRPRRPDMRSGHLGEWWVGGYEGRVKDAGTGRATSPVFRLDRPFLSFLVAGGAWPETRVDVIRISDGRVLATSRGHETEELAPAVHDLTEHVGALLQVVLVDERKGHWAHINFDHLRLHATRPEFGERAAPAGTDEQRSGFPASIAARRMVVPDGFNVDAIAAEPVIHQPIAMTIDARSRIWVAEAYAYPRRMPEGEGHDRILVLEDRDANGSFETVTVFADRLNLVSGLEVGHGGVFVGAAPYLLFIPDKNDDLVPDAEPEVLLDGFGFQDTHETLNAFTFGPDGWLYGCHGVFTHSRVGKPGTPQAERVPMNAAVWRWHPVRRVFETFAEGTSNPWGVDFDADGEAFVSACVIPHLWHLVPEGRYERQAGTHFEPWIYEDIPTIADHRHYVGGNPHGGNGISDSAGGGHAHCGLLIYQGDSFPAEWRGRALMDNIHGNRINADAFSPLGDTFNGSHGRDLLLSEDRFFRAIAFRHAPDGSVLFTDWYDRQACHRNEPEIWDRSNGRIYRLRYGPMRPWTEDLTRRSNLELIALLSHSNAWHQRKAREVLATRTLTSADDAALAARLTDPLPQVRLPALWARMATATLRSDECKQACSDADPSVRAFGVRFLREVVPESALPGALTELASAESHAVVRREIASALLRVPGRARLPALETLARTATPGDFTTALLLWRNLAPTLPAEASSALRILSSSRLPELQRWIPRRMLECGADTQRALFAAVTDSERMNSALDAITAALGKHVAIADSAELGALLASASSDARMQERAEHIASLLGRPEALARAREIALSPSADLQARTRALNTLARRGDVTDRPLFLAALKIDDVAALAADALAKDPAAEVAAALLSAAQHLKEPARSRCLAGLMTRRDGARLALEAITAGTLPKETLDAALRRQIALHGDAALDAALEQVWGRVRKEGRATDRIASMRTRFSVLEGADLPRGRALFAHTCRNCHRLFDDGRSVGPEITGANRADITYLLTNILDPSGEVPREYVLTNVRLQDGRLLSGVVKSESATHLELLTQEAALVIARTDIAMGSDGTPDLWKSESSMMPEDQLQGWPDADVRDLLAYLMNKEQVPMAADEKTLPLFFDGQSLTLWRGDPAVWSVEKGTLVGKTSTGLAHNTFLVSALLLADFRLEVDVELVGNVGNSGIQFRSEPLASGEMKGLQADIGPGWWGVLYEESGRGVLSHPTGTEPGGAGRHHYEIVACGSKVMTAIDGRIAADVDDVKVATRGVIGLQVHSGGPTEVRFSNLRLEKIERAELKSLGSGK